MWISLDFYWILLHQWFQTRGEFCPLGICPTRGHLSIFELIFSLHNLREELLTSQFSSVAQLCPTLWPHGLQACQASLSITNYCSLLKLMSIQSVMPSKLLILCCPLLLLPSIFSSTRVFSNESALCIMWPKYWSFSFGISPSNEYSGLISFRIHWLDLLAVQRDSRVFSNTTVQKHQFFSIIAI